MHQGAVAEALAQVVGLQHHVAEPRPGRDVDLGGVDLAVAVGLGRQLLVALQPGLALGLAGLGVGPHPVELALEHPGALGVLGALDLEAVLLGLQVGGVVAFVGVCLAAVELEDPLRDVVEEVAVVGHGQDGAGVGRQVALEPLHRLGVEVVGGLVEQQQVGLLQQQLAQRDPAPLATGQVVDEHVTGRTAQRVHRLVESAVEVPRSDVVEVGLQVAHLGEQRVVVGLGVGQRLGDLVEPVELALGLVDGLLDVLLHRLALGQRRLLLQHADGGPGVEDRVAVVGLVEPGHDLEQGGLAGAVGAHHADLGAVEERQRDVVEHDLVAVGLAHVAQGEDVVSHDGLSLRAEARASRFGERTHGGPTALTPRSRRHPPRRPPPAPPGRRASRPARRRRARVRTRRRSGSPRGPRTRRPHRPRACQSG